MHWKRIKQRTFLRLVIFAALIIFVSSLAVNLYVVSSTRPCIYREISGLPKCDCALVLGTDLIRPDGTTNSHFNDRVILAAELYASGKVKSLLISGNKNNRGFNEVLEMKEAIVAAHIPESALTLDFEGTRTWDSARRVKENYHLQRIIIVTNNFHAPRAVFLCRHFGINAVAACPAQGDPWGYWPVRYEIREYFARLKMVLDILSNDQI